MSLEKMFNQNKAIIVSQVREMFEIVINWETANKYNILDENGNIIGFAAERTNGIFHRIIRNFLRSHRKITIDIWDNEKNHLLVGIRPFYFFFSDLEIRDDKGKYIGEIKTRFGILKRKYDLYDQPGRVFATIESYRWRLWTFTIFGRLEKELGVISKKWGGFLKEVFTDSDRFAIDLSKNDWTIEQKSVLVFACLSIDLDFFEDNSNSIFDFVGP